MNNNDNKPKIEPETMFKLSYGVYIVTSKDNERDNGCVLNAVMQVTDSPKRISISINKASLTHDFVLNTGIFNVSILSTEAKLPLISQFGFFSGKETDKFKDFKDIERTENGLIYIAKYGNAVISGKVISTKDCGTHTQFLAEVTEAKVLSAVPSMSYQYYLDNVKPKPQPITENKRFYL